MKKQTLARISIILFYGSLWGIVEASIGYLLHFLPALVAGSILFPIVTWILLKAYQANRSRIDLLAIGFLAAAIKGINLLMPSFSVWKTINPMLSIVFEALMVVAVISLLNRNNAPFTIVGLSIASIAWRGLYLTSLWIQSLATGFVSVHIANLENGLTFLIIDGLLSASLAILVYYADHLILKSNQGWMVRKVWLSLTVFAFAIFITIIL